MVNFPQKSLQDSGITGPFLRLLNCRYHHAKKRWQPSIGGVYIRATNSAKRLRAVLSYNKLSIGFRTT
ncbi:MAG: hypothetical protein DYG96_02830 [Chlorobi bacterium CHB2]|nr:hypothetical protein [Chlorobi bacterium CHB2]